MCLTIELILPLEIDGLDNETQSWTNSADILIHDSFHDGCLAGIIKASDRLASYRTRSVIADSIKIRISLSLRRALRSTDSISRGVQSRHDPTFRSNM